MFLVYCPGELKMSFHNYGIFFKHPRTEKHGLESLSPDWRIISSSKNSDDPLDKWYINIEVINKDNVLDPEQIKDFLDKHWNSQKKLLKLQEHGSVWKLATNVKDCDTEVSHFRSEYKGKMEKYEDERTGELTYYIEQKDYPDAILKIPLYATLGKDLIKSDCEDNEWECAFIFNEMSKMFDILKINLD
jgi:hypothetical protein